MFTQKTVRWIYIDGWINWYYNIKHWKQSLHVPVLRTVLSKKDTGYSDLVVAVTHWPLSLQLMLMHHDCSFSERANKQTIAGNAVNKKASNANYCIFFLYVFRHLHNAKQMHILKEIIIIILELDISTISGWCPQQKNQTCKMQPGQC